MVVGVCVVESCSAALQCEAPALHYCTIVCVQGFAK